MTRSASSTRSVEGVQRPSVCWVPPYVSSSGGEAVELARAAGLVLDPWQEFVLVNGLGERADGKWAAFEVGLDVSRQNGKGSVLEARELAGLFLLGERLLIHSAHQFDTSLEAFRRLLGLIEEADFQRDVKRVSRSHGEEGIELKSGQRIRFRTRTKGGGRGFTGDCLILDEAMILPESAHGALMPTLSARPNPQIWYTGSAVDREVHEHGVVFSRVRDRGRKGDDPGLAWFEFTAGVELEAAMVPEVAQDRALWAEANPGLGIRISVEHVEREQRSMDPRTFAVERLGVGDWPVAGEEGANLLDYETWVSCRDDESRIVGPVCFAFDVQPDRSAAAIAVSGRRADGRMHVEIVQHGRGTVWVPGRLVELVGAHDAVGVVCDGIGPAASLIPALEEAGVTVEATSSQELGRACGMIVDGVEQDGLRYFPSVALDGAVRGARPRPLGDAWKWSRKDSTVDIGPLVAVTLALWGAETLQPAGDLAANVW